MNTGNEILGCYASIMNGDKNGDAFRNYIWGDLGISKKMKTLKHEKYGKDILMILFQFYVNPIPYLAQNLKEIEGYRKTEKSIGIPIIINNDNYFNKSQEEGYDFLKKSILKKLDVLADVVKKKKLDTNIGLLKSDLAAIL